MLFHFLCLAQDAVIPQSPPESRGKKKREKNVNLGSKSAQCFIPASCPRTAFHMTFFTAQNPLLLKKPWLCFLKIFKKSMSCFKVDGIHK